MGVKLEDWKWEKELGVAPDLGWASTDVDLVWDAVGGGRVERER